MIHSMKKEIQLLDRKINYTLHQKTGTKRIWLKIRPDGNLIVSAPRRIKEEYLNALIIMKSKWILAKMDYYDKNRRIILPIEKEKQTEHCRGALELVRTRLEHYNKIYGFKYSKISVRNQKSRWGSCSKQGNLSFNFRVLLLPSKLADYIIVHELCHLGQMNHSPNYWKLVARAIPDHLKIRNELRHIHLR